MFLIFLTRTKIVFFLEQNQFLQLLKLVQILHQNFNFEIVYSNILPQWRLRISNLLFKMAEVFAPESPDYVSLYEKVY